MVAPADNKKIASINAPISLEGNSKPLKDSLSSLFKQSMKFNNEIELKNLSARLKCFSIKREKL